VGGLAAGLIGADGRLTPGVIAARAVVIAAGGLGQAFGTTSNPAGATGDGIAVAARAGAVIRDLEFVQFHPTVLWLPGASGQCPLVTEALRGAGAVLRDLDGTPLMAGHDPRGDLAPRDVVAARMAEVIAAGDAGHVWLDATALGAGVLEHGFPTVTAACRKHGIDPVTAMIPVAPGAHYSCGGIAADLDGRTSVPGLYAAGEAASTGAQGANRLASNSVTEAVIAGRRTGAAVADALSVAGDTASLAPPARPSPETRDLRPTAGMTAANAGGQASAAKSAHADQPAALSQSAGTGAQGSAGAQAEAGPRRQELALAMSRDAGVLRDADGLARLVRALTEAGGIRAAGTLDQEEVEAANLRTVSLLIAAGALRRTESRGCHRRRDAAGAAAAPRHTLARWDGQQLVMTEENSW
jgi:L-aspartate oxidase